MLSGGLVVQPADHYSTMNVSMNMSVDGVSPPQHPLALLLLTIPMLTIFGNALVIAAVCREKSLRTVTNLLLVSLALADLLVATFVMSFAVYFEVSSDGVRLDD
jgi:dopamine D2-like receptor